MVGGTLRPADLTCCELIFNFCDLTSVDFCDLDFFLENETENQKNSQRKMFIFGCLNFFSVDFFFFEVTLPLYQTDTVPALRKFR